MKRTGCRRPGLSLVELTTTFALLGILSVACGALVRSQAQLLKQTSEHAATDETIRTARAILHAELRDIGLGDMRGASADSLAFRVFRGFGIVCAVAEDDVVLRYRGLREPDPEKDSLLVISDERTTAFRVVTDRPLCVPRVGEHLIAIDSAGALQAGELVLFFESGAYHLANRALRYRRGTEGRQPLTDELIEDRWSGFSMQPGGVRVFLRGAGVGADTDAYIRFSNRGQ